MDHGSLEEADKEPVSPTPLEGLNSEPVLSVYVTQHLILAGFLSYVDGELYQSSSSEGASLALRGRYSTNFIS